MELAKAKTMAIRGRRKGTGQISAARRDVKAAFLISDYQRRLAV